MTATRRPGGGCRRGAGRDLRMALALAAGTVTATACHGASGGSAERAANSAPVPPASRPSAARTPGLLADEDAAFVRAQPGTSVDVVIRRNYGRARWTGPWDLDLGSLTLNNNSDWLVITLQFSRLNLVRSGVRGGQSIGDSLSVFLDGNGDREYEREIYLNWGNPGGLLTEVDDQALRCRFDHDLDGYRRTVTFRIPHTCFPHLTRMRARAVVNSARLARSATWFGQDLSQWTAFADVGQTVTVSDPAQ